MPEAAITSVFVFEDGGATIMARIIGNDAANITQASLTTITYSVFDLDSATPETPVSGHDAQALTVANVVFNALQTGDARWADAGGDLTGFNFLHAIAATAFPSAHRYAIEYLFNPASGENFWHVVEAIARPVRTS